MPTFSEMLLRAQPPAPSEEFARLGAARALEEQANPAIAGIETAMGVGGTFLDAFNKRKRIAKYEQQLKGGVGITPEMIPTLAMAMESDPVKAAKIQADLQEGKNPLFPDVSQELFSRAMAGDKAAQAEILSKARFGSGEILIKAFGWGRQPEPKDMTSALREIERKLLLDYESADTPEKKERVRQSINAVRSRLGITQISPPPVEAPEMEGAGFVERTIEAARAAGVFTKKKSPTGIIPKKITAGQKIPAREGIFRTMAEVDAARRNGIIQSGDIITVGENIFKVP